MVIGDLNIDFLKKTSASCRKARDMGRALNLMQVIQEATRITKSTSALIDVCFINIRHIAKSGIIEWSVSDHYPIYLIKKKINLQEEKVSFKGRDYTRLNTEDFEKDILSMPLDRVLSEPNPELAWDIYFGFIIHVANKYCPEKTYIISSKRPPHGMVSPTWGVGELGCLVVGPLPLSRGGWTKGPIPEWDQNLESGWAIPVEISGSVVEKSLLVNWVGACKEDGSFTPGTHGSVRERL